MVTQCLLPNVEYIVKSYIKDIIDKGKMTLVCLSIDVFEMVDGKEVLALSNESTLALLKFKANGFKGVEAMSKMRKLPTRKQDYILEAASYPNQAFLYRLTGDDNPLHVDPKFAAIQKLPKPIIHGIFFLIFRISHKGNYRSYNCRAAFGE